MRTAHILGALGGILMMAACDNTPRPTYSPTAGSAPAGTTATGQPSTVPQASGPAGIDRGYYQGANPNFQRGSSGSGSRSN